ncbi:MULTISPECIES: SRPBCC domain-containing protein [Natrialbaceae]|uniref:SRPBCC domain-containing protein n=1 Tax=Natrialbaceae TaxID=1644061 RepID=UPI00207C20AF|nr:SRPBCC domain-containing protein [Natronococcus sp. CG52]
MNQVEVFEEIDAPPAAVWDALLEFSTDPALNPFVRSMEDVPVIGERLRSRAGSGGSRPSTFQPEVIAVEKGRRLVWHGRLFLPFTFDGYHEFHLEPIGDGSRTRLLQRETVRGALVPLLFDERRFEREFRELNETIKERAERRVNVAS